MTPAEKLRGSASFVVFMYELKPLANLDALFAGYRSLLLRYFCRAIGRSDLAQDLTQDVFARASGATVPSAPDGVRAWLFRIARNLALDYRRAQQRRPAASSAFTEPARPTRSPSNYRGWARTPRARSDRGLYRSDSARIRSVDRV